jgi:hypothetical protein
MAAGDRIPNGRWSTTGQCTRTRRLQYSNRYYTGERPQIWLLRNIFWWYLLPPGISIMAFFVHLNWTWRDRLVARLLSKDWLDVLDALGHAVPFVVVIGVYCFIYWLNQYAVRTQLEPRRQELLTLLMSFEVEKPDAS